MPIYDNPLMHGAQFAKQYVSNYLQLDIPQRVVRYRNGWDISDTELPSPAKYLTYEPLALDDWPTIITVAINTSGFERIAYDGPDPLYRVDYVMRTYIWCRALGSEEATIARDRLTTVVRSALLELVKILPNCLRLNSVLDNKIFLTPTSQLLIGLVDFHSPFIGYNWLLVLTIGNKNGTFIRIA